ncbi:serine hydrolase domain-containing protein [Galactobacter caseinivorans]|uniref:Class A beta-lactamase-related serine hydrolase n=1 Tax=Galactobacter caseinivorans TaxID=2676123 RepID=A0A496PK43_9MICC|nr:serine hydrolase domain-containing protein [Galactobacter caseinivorans]RKW70856.1 class A beta-lactamase-related serine hydrolase [Galactobacter caseinivorans]
MSCTVPIYSIAKTFTAVAALRSLDLDLPVGDYVASLRPDLAALTCRDLLTHRSGVSDYAGWADYRAAVKARETPWPAQAILERAEVGSPGSFLYSNIGFLLLRQALEQHHTAQFFDVLQDLVLTPLGMAARAFATPEDWSHCNHPAIDDRLRTYHPGWVYPGTFAADPQEAARGLALVMQGALGEDVAQALRAGRLVGAPASHPMSPAAGYGLGVMTSGHPIDVLGHGGQGPGFTLFAATSADGARWHGEAQGAEGQDTDLIRRCLTAVRP